METLQVSSILLYNNLLKGDGGEILKRVAKAITEAISDEFGAKKKYTRIFLIIWLILVVLLAAVSGIILLASYLITGNMIPGLYITTFLWGVLFGGAILFFLRSKYVTAVFGCLFGLSVGQATGATILTECNKAITGMAQQIGLIAGLRPGDQTVLHLLWTFAVTLLVICLPAFSGD